MPKAFLCGKFTFRVSWLKFFNGMYKAGFKNKAGAL